MAIQIFRKKDEVNTEISGNRGNIYNYILLNPGTYLRKIFKDVGLAMGDTQYNLSILEKKGYVKSRKVGQHRHYYPMSVNSEHHELILAYLRQETTRDILIYIIENIGPTQSDLSNFKHFSTPSIYWHMTRLISSGLIVSFRERRVIRYYVRDISCLTECVRKYMPDIWMNLTSKFAVIYSNVTKRILSENHNNNLNVTPIMVSVRKR